MTQFRSALFVLAFIQLVNAFNMRYFTLTPHKKIMPDLARIVSRPECIRTRANEFMLSKDSADDNSITVVTVPPQREKKLQQFKSFLVANWLVIGEIIVIMLAKHNPHFGATGGPLRPEITVSKLGVFTIFFINGIALSISGSPSELQTATKTNTIIQLFNYGFIPLVAKILVPFYPVAAFRFVFVVIFYPLRFS